MDSPWAPFRSDLDWNIARWLKTHRVTSTAVTQLLAMPGVSIFNQLITMYPTEVRKVIDGLGLSFHTVKDLNEKIDSNLPGRPHFQCKKLTVDGESLEFYSRDAIASIRSLYGDPQFAQQLAFAPERHYTSHERTTRIYNEMYTGDWWWKVQVSNTLINSIAAK
jgi:hypothetical protein